MCTQTKHVPAGLAGMEVLSASSLGEAKLSSAYSLWSNDGGGSESRSMSFTRPDLRGSRVTSMIGTFMKWKILEVSIEFRVKIR